MKQAIKAVSISVVLVSALAASAVAGHYHGVAVTMTGIYSAQSNPGMNLPQ